MLINIFCKVKMQLVLNAFCVCVCAHVQQVLLLPSRIQEAREKKEGQQKEGGRGERAANILR